MIMLLQWRPAFFYPYIGVLSCPDLLIYDVFWPNKLYTDHEFKHNEVTARYM